MTARTNTTARSTATAATATVEDVTVKVKVAPAAKAAKRARRVFPEATARVVTPDAVVPEEVSPLNSTMVDDEALEAHARGRFTAELHDLWSKLGGKLDFEFSPRVKTILLVIAKVLMYAIGAVATAVLITSLSTILQGWGWNLFIVAVIELTGFILGCIASWYASDAIIDFVATGGVKRNVDRVFGKVGGFFTRSPKPTTVAAS